MSTIHKKYVSKLLNKLFTLFYVLAHLFKKALILNINNIKITEENPLILLSFIT